jgi:hypothetical protein
MIVDIEATAKNTPTTTTTKPAIIAASVAGGGGAVLALIISLSLQVLCVYIYKKIHKRPQQPQHPPGPPPNLVAQDDQRQLLAGITRIYVHEAKPAPHNEI